MVEGRATDRTEQDSIGGEAGLECVVREWMVVGGEARSAYRFGGELDFMVKDFGNGVEDAEGYFRNFRANAVAGESGDFQKQGFLI